MKTSHIFIGVVVAIAALCTLSYLLLGQPIAAPAYVSYSRDAVITQTIKSKFVMDAQASGTRINVKTLDGAVLLSGYAKSDKEKSAAEGIAHRVKGV